MKLNLTSAQLNEYISSEVLGNQTTFLIDEVAYDTRKISEGLRVAFVAIKGELRDGHQFVSQAFDLGVKVFILSDREVAQKLRQQHADVQIHLVEDGLKAIQRLATHHRLLFSYPVIAITGSVGKTTVKEWLYHLLSDSFHIVRSPKSYNSQLGVALSLLEMGKEHNLALIEAGISKPEEMQVLQQMIHPTLGVFTSFGSAHAHNFISKEQQLSEKMKLFSGEIDVFASEEIPIPQQGKIHKIGGEDFSNLTMYAAFQDKASIQNLKLALAVSAHLSIHPSSLISKIKTLPRLALRMETFEGINGNLIINDTYNADLDALTQSLEYQLSVAGAKKRTALIGIEGLNEQQIQKIRQKLKNYNLYQSFLVTEKDEVDLDAIHHQVVLIKGTRQSQMQLLAKKFQLKKHKTRIEVNLSAVKHNLVHFKSLLHEHTKILAMVKAAAYGSGAEKMAEFLEKNGVSYLGVAYADEGIELRKAGIKLPILVMNAEEDSFDDIISYQLEPSIYSFEMLEAFTKALINYSKERFPVHLKFDTGMRRLGFEVKDVQHVIEIVQSQPELLIKSVYSHLAESDNLESKAFTEDQISKFKQVVNQFKQSLSYPFLAHILNSEGIARFAHAQFDMVRLGIGLYGETANIETKKQLRPCIFWKSVISQLKTIQKGESVGYSRAFVADQTTTIAIIPVGYADGIRRSLSKGKGQFFINGHKVKIVGNVCMDMLMLDVTGIACKAGDEVEIIGEHLTLEELATSMQTIPYEVLTSLSKRLQRVYLED